MKHYKFKCLSGVNLPMVLEALISRNMDNMDIGELAQKCLESGIEGIRNMEEGLEVITRA